MAAPKLRFKEFDGTWKESRLKDLAVKITDGTHDTPVVQKEGIPFLTAINVKDGLINYDDIGYVDEITHKKIYERCNPEKDDLLIVNIGAGTATCARNIVDYQFSLKNVALVKPNRNFLNPIFLEQIQRKNSSKLFASLTSGGAQPFLSLKEIGKLLIKYPSKEEQTKIASFLSNVDEKISQLTQKHELLSQYKQGMMQKLFSQQIRFKADDGSEFGEWEDKTIEQIANFRRGSFPQPYGLPEWLDSNGFPFVQVYDVSDKMLLKERTKIKISQLAADQSVFAKQGTLIITIQGSIGRIAKMQYDAYVDRTLLIFQSYNYEVDVDYFKYALFLLFNIEKERAEGAIIKTITKETLSKFIVQLPCLEEQTKIANFLSAIDQKIEVVAQQIEQAKQWKKGLLQQMFV